MQEGDASADTVNAVFRAVHSVKGGAGAFKFADLVAFAHTFETLMDKIRSGSVVAEHAVVKVLLRAADKLADLVSASRDGRAIEASSYTALLAELDAAGKSASAAPAAAPEDEFEAIDFTPSLIAIDSPAAKYEIEFRPFAELYRKANEPLALLREMEQLGHIEVTTDASAIPALEAFDWNASYLAFSITLETDKGEQAVRDVFEFVDGDCELTIKCEAPTRATCVASCGSCA